MNDCPYIGSPRCGHVTHEPAVTSDSMNSGSLGSIGAASEWAGPPEPSATDITWDRAQKYPSTATTVFTVTMANQPPINGA